MGLTLEQMKERGATAATGISTDQLKSAGATPSKGFFKENGLDSAMSSLSTSQRLVDQSKVFQTPLTRIASGEAATTPEVGLGQAKAGLREFASAGAQNAGPIGQGMLNAAPGLKPAFEGLEQATTPTTADQAQGYGQFQTVSNALGGGKGAQSTLGNFFAARKLTKETGKALDLIKATEETMTKGERLKAATRMKPTLTGGGKFEPSDIEKHAASLLRGNLEKNPVKNVPIIQKEIAKRGKEAEDFLAKNPQSVTEDEMVKILGEKRADIAKYSTDAELKAYDEQIQIFARHLPEGKQTDTLNLYKGLKDYEENVTSRLPKGKQALLVETGSAKNQAAKDIREAARDVLRDKYKYGQVGDDLKKGKEFSEFSDRMYDLAALYDVFDTMKIKAIEVGSFAERHPWVTGSAKWGGGLAAASLGIDEFRKRTGI